MADDRILIGIPELCRMLGWTRAWFYQNEARLHAEEDFPAPAKRIGQKQYSRALVRAWADRAVADYPSPVDGSAQAEAEAERQRSREWLARRSRPKFRDKSKET